MEDGLHGDASVRLLCLHPEDSPECGPWIAERWDRIVDLGIAAEQTHARWSKVFNCPIEPIPKFEIEDFAEVRQALGSRLGCVVDEHGLDWWELISIRFHEHIALVLRLQKLTEQLASNDEVFATRPGFHAEILNLLMGRTVHCIRKSGSALGRARRVIGAARNFNLPQLLQILGDKYDAGYRIRRVVTHQQPSSETAVVLLPVAQRNAARTAISYAVMVPDHKFLLVATRQSGWINGCPANVTCAKLAAYAPGKRSEREFRHLWTRWQQVESGLDCNREISMLRRLGVFSGVAKMLSDGLAIRDAWLRVFESEPVGSVFCTDDTNPYTHLPLLLARERGLPTIVCHHGALDGGYLVKKTHADAVLAKGRMEKDYLVNTCGLPAEKIEIGAPPLPPQRKAEKPNAKSSIIFFSEPYSLDGGRCGELYRELLPPLVELASRMNCEVVVKLHPMESVRERRKLVDACLSPQQRKNVRIVTGVLSEELVDRAWFAVTVQSTAAVDCTLRAIPVFLCTWLDYSYYGYLDQFIRFRAGVPLQSPEEIAEIPSVLKQFSAPSTRDLWQTISPERLKQLLVEPLRMATAV
jgi:hypothetical protein